MSRQNRDPYNNSNLPARLVWGSARLIIFAVVMMVFMTAVFLLRSRYQQAVAAPRAALEQGDPNLSSAERAFLQGFLQLNRGRILEPIGSGVEPAEFVVSSGQNANQIAINLASVGLLDPGRESLFLNYLRFYGLDSQLEAGTFLISPGMDIPTLAQTLANSSGNDVTLTFLEGWRVEQMAAYLNAVQAANINGDQFLALVTRQETFDLSAFSFLAGIGPEQSLEGFMFPDTYRVPLDADATYLANLMLQTFDERVTPAMRQAYGLRGLTVPQAVTVASIVEREAVLADEQPTISSVFLNRLAQGIKLDADPTVQYAVGYDAASDSWWKAPLTVDDLRIDSPYNTYLGPGLPPSPIANPGFGALDAVANPVETEYIFFVAECEGLAPGSHLFSVTYEEHLANVETCR